jgi:hypothetical protein
LTTVWFRLAQLVKTHEELVQKIKDLEFQKGELQSQFTPSAAASL